MHGTSQNHQTASSPAIQIRVQSGVGTISIHREPKRNALSREMISDIQQGLSDLHQEKRVRCVVLTGSADYFSAGTDLSEIYSVTASPLETQQQWFADGSAYLQLIEQMLRFPKPIIAAVNGPALGLGAALVLACDLSIASNIAEFGFPESRLGLVAGLAAPLLAYRAGGTVASELLLRTASVSAQQCQTWQIYGEVVEPEQLASSVERRTSEIASSPAEALAMTKRLLNETVAASVLTCLASGAAMLATARTTESAQEAVTAFLQKRPPVWPT